MLDIKAIRNDPEGYKQLLDRKRHSGISEVLYIDEERRKVITELNDYQHQLNTVSAEIPKARENKANLIAKAKTLSEKVKEFKRFVRVTEDALDTALMCLPNVPLDDVPRGKGEEDNVLVSQWGAARKEQFDFPLMDHLEVAEAHDLLDFERGAKIAGSGFPVWKGLGAKLERALITYMLDFHTAAAYTEILPPLLVNRTSARGTGQLPNSQLQMYKTTEDSLYLIPTAEVPVTNLHRDEIVENLPIKYCAYSPCFRREAGGHGKKTRGFLRVHQFNKVELVQIVEGDLSVSSQVLMDIRESAESILQGLGLHYRVIELCDADLSFAAAKCYDLEVWAPAEGRYLEASSCSNFLDFQARRMNLRYRDVSGKTRFCHTLNGSGLATSRVLVAILESYQTPEGHLRIPEALQPYMGGIDIIYK